MPKFKSPFSILPSAPPPGSSHFISNALIVAKRVALGLEHPVRIKEAERIDGDPLYDWYTRHQYSLIKHVQLRKEKKAPFFHEYVALELDDGTFFRIDRRQVPDEQSPMDCARKEGVEAYDTIEEITSLEDSMYNASDCIVHVDYLVPKEHPDCIFDTCDRISKDIRASAYTVQRYNCYFYAQTVLLCTLGAGIPNKVGERNPDPLYYAYPPYYWISDVTDIRILGKEQQTSVWPFRRQKSMLQHGDNKQLVLYLGDLIRAHSLRVEQYKFLLGCSAAEVERDMKEKISKICNRGLVPRAIAWDGNQG